jgi:excisionase family DNA binding protein
MSESKELSDLAAAFRELAEAIRSAPKPDNDAALQEEWMTLDDAAKWLGLHEQTIRETIAAEDPPWAKRFGRAIRISRTLLMQAPSTPTRKKRPAK